MKTIRDLFDSGEREGTITMFGMKFVYDPGDRSLTFHDCTKDYEAEFIFTPKGDKVHAAWSYLGGNEYCNSIEMDMDEPAYDLCFLIMEELKSLVDCEE